MAWSDEKKSISLPKYITQYSQDMSNFTHLHVHTQYSILDGAANIQKLIQKTKELGMEAIAITDHGNMYGVLEFHDTAIKAGIKPIIGCEMYVAKESRFLKRGREDYSGEHLVLLAKNYKGYENLIKLDTLAFDKDAFYMTPRIDKEILFEYSEGLICSSACLGGEIPQFILSGNIEAAEKAALEYKEVFGDDYYLELQNHGLEDQELVNKHLIEIGRKHNIKLLATNDVHYIEKEDYEAHHILVCLNTGRTISDSDKMMYSGEEYLKSPEEMSALFKDVPEAITNSMEIANKVEIFELRREPILPIFDIPEDFAHIEEFYSIYPIEKIKEEYTEEDFEKKGGYEKIIRIKFDSAYLKHLTYQGAKRLYGEDLSDELVERIEFELSTIEWMGYPGYFLIVQDFINHARKNLGVIVGPGRGSAAGSVVAYCLGITTIDPIRYGLLFERFLNPDRVSLPDVDVDFDDEGRAKVLEYVQNKYGVDQVAQVITFGTMAAKSAIRDVARILELPLNESDRLAKLVPDRPGVTLDEAFAQVAELRDAMENGSELVKKTLRFAKELEGSIRNTGTHACGVIIGPDDLSKYIPLSSSKDSDMMVSQFEGNRIENVGMIKMDFLGLKTLSIIKDAVENIELNHGIKIDIESVSLEDEKTFELFQKGNSIGTFQFESDGMRQHLQNLKPDRIEDLIAMNALYRPGPMQYIPNFIARKRGIEEITYDLPIMEEHLAETYGITVYQEQVMQLSRLIGGFTRGEADVLRKAMGKKIREVMDELKEKFFIGAENNGYDLGIVDKVWHDWEKFAEYAFNKSHSTCYAYIAYRTAYLKANYPGEYMASVLTHNLNNISKITYYIEEAQRQGLKVLGPCINNSRILFTSNTKGEIRFGLAAIKSVGEAAARSIIEERDENGPYESPFDFVKRLDSKTINKRAMEALIKAGAFDMFEDINRAQYFTPISNSTEEVFLERLIKLGNSYKDSANSAQASLFGEEEDIIVDPEVPESEDWSSLEKLKHEKDSVGFYLSGHPLDKYDLEIRSFANTRVEELNTNMDALENKSLYIGGMITGVQEKMTKTGNQFGVFSLEDQSGAREFALFGKDYINFGPYLKEGLFVLFSSTVLPKRWGVQEGVKELEVRINKIELLEEVMNSHCSGINLLMPVENINDEFVDEISKIAKNNKGDTRLNFIVEDIEDNVQLTLKSRNRKVDVSSFVADIEDMINNRTITSFNLSRRN